MQRSEANKKRINRKKTKSQKVWEYMRRNPDFRVGEMIAIFKGTKYELTDAYLKSFLWALVSAEYVELTKEAKEYRNREYRLVKNTGLACPSILKDEIYDHNTGEKIQLDHEKRQATRTTNPELLLLQLLIRMEMTKKEVLDESKLTKKTGSRYWEKLSNAGIVSLKIPQMVIDRSKVFTIDMKKRDERIRELKGDGQMQKGCEGPACARTEERSAS